MREYPCFAYIPGRSAEDCLLKSSAHCNQVKAMFSQHAGPAQKPALCGGLQICVDLSQAFDRVSRSLVEESIRQAGFTREVEASLTLWLHGGTFRIDHKGHSVDIPCTKGVKQGSRGGPYQWNLVTRYLLWQLAKQKGHQWILDHVINFADDYHVSWIGHSETSLHRATRDAADLFSLLESAGLKINLAKSAAILRIQGTRFRAFQKNFIVKRPNGVFLKCCTTEGKAYHVPIVKKWNYLGSTLSYFSFDADTVARRIQAADHAFLKLKNVLGSRRSLPMWQRLRVCDACVNSTLLYAVIAVGIGPREARTIHYTVMRHLRLIAHSARHITRRYVAGSIGHCLWKASNSPGSGSVAHGQLAC